MPLLLNMWGINIYTGGHYDNYVVNYYGYREGPAPAGTFNKPHICPDKPDPEDELTPHHKQAGLHAQIRRMLPNPHHGEHLASRIANAQGEVGMELFDLNRAWESELVLPPQGQHLSLLHCANHAALRRAMVQAGPWCGVAGVEVLTSST